MSNVERLYKRYVMLNSKHGVFSVTMGQMSLFKKIFLVFILGIQLIFLYGFSTSFKGTSFHSVNRSENPEAHNNRANANENRITWLAHLCPKRKHHEERMLPIRWLAPTQETIFFVKTSCHTYLSSREACAIESVLNHHPDRPVMLFMASPSINQSHPMLKLLLSRSNFRLSWMDFDEVFREEPLRSWHEERSWMLSEKRMSAVLNDVSRAELLRRYGGTYVDLDALTLRPLPISMTNWMMRVDHRLVALAVSSFVPGHSLMKEITENIPKVFEPYSCCSVGPEIVTSLLHHRCPKNITFPTSAGQEDFEYCDDITVFPRKLFCPIHYGYQKDQLQSIFAEGLGLGPRFFATTKAFSLHLFHSLSNKRAATLDSDSIVIEAAKRNCPNVYQELKVRKKNF